MNYQWILLALFMVAIILGVSRSLKRSFLKNTLRLASVIVAFLITFILQISGVFQGIVTSIMEELNLFASSPALSKASTLLNAIISTFVTPIFFVIVFLILVGIIRLIVSIVLDVIKKNIEKKANKPTEVVETCVEVETKADILSQENEIAPAEGEESKADETIAACDDTSASEEIKADENIDANTASTEVFNQVEEIVNEPVEEKPAKKGIFYNECAWKRAISVASGIISGLLMLGVILMPLFYFMSVFKTVTDSIEGSDADDSKIYNLVKVVDDNIYEPFDNSFVNKFYDCFGISDLMNYTSRAGGKLTLDNGDTVYADDVLKTVIHRGLRATVQITSLKSECSTVRDDVNALINDPTLSSILTDIVVDVINGIESEKPADEDLIGGLTYNFVQYYKNADESIISSDLKVVGDTIGILAEEGILVQIIVGDAELSSLLEDGDTLENVVEAISVLSAFGPVLEDAFEMGVEILGDTLNIPKNDLEVYDRFIDDIIVKMQREEGSTKFDSTSYNAVRYYIVTCANTGIKVSSSNGIKGHKQFMDYVSQWKQVQGAFSNASEDKSYGYFSIEINNTWYIYDDSDASNKRIVIYSEENAEEYKDKISPVSGLINALTLRSTTKELTKEGLYSILEAYASTATDEASRDLANRLLDRDSFVSNAATVEKMQAATNFTNWTDEEKAVDSKICVKIIMNLLTLMDNMEQDEEMTDKENALHMLDQFQLLGQTMDDMKQTSCINELPSLLIEGIVKNEAFSKYMKPSTAFQINNIVENNNKTYVDCMIQIKSVLNLAINAFGGSK